MIEGQLEKTSLIRLEILVAEPHKFHPEGFRLDHRRSAKVKEEGRVVRVSSRKIGDGSFRVGVNLGVICKTSVKSFQDETISIFILHIGPGVLATLEAQVNEVTVIKKIHEHINSVEVDF